MTDDLVRIVKETEMQLLTSLNTVTLKTHAVLACEV